MELSKGLRTMAIGALALGAAPALANDSEAEKEQRRDQLITMADEAVKELRETNETAALLLDEAYGVAVFDATKGGLIVTGTGGTGVATPVAGGEAVFMHMGGGGLALGAGLKNYKLVLLIEDQETYEQFVDGQWDGTVSAQAAAGESATSEQEHFANGVMAYQVDQQGLIAQADLSGIRFWTSSNLNEIGGA